jgi:hypothetical protein
LKKIFLKVELENQTIEFLFVISYYICYLNKVLIEFYIKSVMEYWWEILSVFLLSSVKFVFGGVPMALGFKFSFIEAVVVSSLGGFSGVLTFVTLSEKILKFYFSQKAKKKSQYPDTVDKKKFTRRNKTIINVKNKFGLLGFSFLVPFFLPIPLGCFLAVRYFNNKKRIILYLFGSILFWSITVSSIQLFFK